MPNYTESYSLIDDGITVTTVTGVIEKAEKIQNYPQLSHVEEQQLSIVLVEQVKNQMIQRLDSDGEGLFLQAYTFFKKNTFDTKIVKLIQLYSGLAGQIRFLLEHLKYWADQYGEPPVNSQPQTTSRVAKTIWEY